MTKGTVRATKASDGTVRIASRTSQKASERIGAAPSSSLNKAFQKGVKLTKPALLAILTVRGSKLNEQQARKEVDRIFQQAQPIHVKKILETASKEKALATADALQQTAKKIISPLTNKSGKVIEGYKNPATQAFGIDEMMKDPDFADFVLKMPDDNLTLFSAYSAYTAHLKESGNPKFNEYNRQLTVMQRQIEIAQKAVEQAKRKSK